MSGTPAEAWPLSELHARAAANLARQDVAAPPAGGPQETTACCDLHNRNCEPPSELCCENCAEARHAGWTDERGTWRYGHPRGEECVLSGRPQEAATPLPRFLGHPDDLCEQWIAETWENDPNASWDREDMMSAYREGRDEARRQLAPAWDALAAEKASLRKHAQSLAEDLDDAAEHITEWRREAERLRAALERIRDDKNGSTLTLRGIARDALKADG